MKLYNGEWISGWKYHFLSKREKEYIENPTEFEKKHGNNYARQIRFRIRTKIEAALSVIDLIAIKQNRDKKFYNKTTRTLKKDSFDPLRIGLLDGIEGYIHEILNGLGYENSLTISMI